MGTGKEHICERNDEIRRRHSQGVKPSREREEPGKMEREAGITWQARAVLEILQREKPTAASQISFLLGLPPLMWHEKLKKISGNELIHQYVFYTISLPYN